MSDPVIVTSALPYANGPIHFGHIVGAYLPADVYVRFRRMCGDDVHFLCGTDEHGVAITLKAEKEGVAYPDYVDHWHERIHRTLQRFGIEFDAFSGTASHRNEHHAPLAQQFFTDLLRNGWLVEREEEQFFSESTQRFLPDRYVEGTCYLCGYDKARGDECPRCGKFLESKRLLEPRSTIDGSRPVLKSSKHWYLDLGRARDEWLRAWFLGKHGQWKPNVENFVLGDLAELRERPITRDLPWGVPVPLPGTAGKVLYVWFDAPIGYLSISKQYFAKRGEPERFEKLWRSPNTRLFHFIGKDNITFHAVIFPAMLKGTGRGWILPENVPANEFFNFEGRKFNTSSGWFVPESSVADDPTDVLRWALCSMMPETADSEWTWSEFQARVNGDLADNLGNFVTRTLRFVEKFFEGAIPPRSGETLAQDKALDDAAVRTVAEVREHFGSFRFRRALAAILALGGECNRYFDAEQPWVLVKQTPTRRRAGDVMHACCRMIDLLAVLIAPVMPATARLIRRAMHRESVPLAFASIAPRHEFPNEGIRGAPLTTVFPKFRDERGEEKTALFRKVTDERVASERARLAELASAAVAPAPATTVSPTKSPAEALAATVDYEGFTAVDLRAATIVAAERHPKADRLLVLRVDLGFQTRTIVAGIAASYSPEELVGRRVIAVANLAPRTLRGVESQGMLLAGDDAGGKPRLLAPDAATPDGVRVR
ncbi:MAG: methionine--tRNA ligase [Planctomycetes bacterium]|nr:methionine--tRNA ligase [Planctomycetota bacterium]